MPGPLDGIRVLDMSAVVAGPVAGTMLADQGADVIKIERPERGDIQRRVGSNRNGFSGMFHVLNRGKRSLEVDLATDEGTEIVHRLAEGADVVIQNFRPGVVERLGVGYEDLKAANPRIIYASISGFGAKGPSAFRGAYDPIIQASSGFVWAQGRPEGEPRQVNQLIMDKVTGVTTAQAISSALYAREKTGLGQHVEVAMLDAGVNFLWLDVGSDSVLTGEGIDHRPAGGAAGRLGEFADGWATTMTLNDREFRGFCTVFGLDWIFEDERFATLEARMQNRPALTEIMQTEIVERSKKMSLAEAERLCEEHKVPFGRVNTIDELADDPQVIATGLLVEDEHPVAGTLRHPRPAAIFSETPTVAGGPAPTIGQHTREVLAEIGREEDADALIEQGIVGETGTGF